MFKKIIIIFKIIFNTNFKILKKNKIKYIIFDREGSDNIIKLLPINTFMILDTRVENLKSVYLSKKIILNTLKNFLFLKQKIFNAYLISTIYEVNPLKIITFIDNSIKFFEISKSLEKKFQFIAIQQSARYDILRYKLEYKKKIRNKDLSKKFYIPNFYCFGEYEKEHYIKHRIIVKKFQKIGSLKLMLAMSYLKKRNIKIKKNKYDICLVSDDGYNFNKTFREKKLESDFSLIAFYAIKYAKKFNKKFIFVWKRFTKSSDHKKEYDFYKENLSKEDFNYLLKNSIYKENIFNSYKIISESKIVIGVATTMLREKLSLRGKILTCNYTKLSMFNFPKDAIFVLKDYGYQNFEQKLNYLLKMRLDKYLNKTKNDVEYIIKYYEKKDLENLRKEITK